MAGKSYRAARLAPRYDAAVISVIVPVRGEGPPAAAFLERLGASPVGGGAGRNVELLVAATRSTPVATLKAYSAHGAAVEVTDGARGWRLSCAASASRGDILLFLHADTLLPEGWAGLVEGAIGSGAVAGAFRLGFDGGGGRMAWVAFWANLRTGLTRVPYGDQAPFVRRDVYERLGGHKAWPLLEDVELGRRLRDAGPIRLLPQAVLTSPRRYLERGVARTVLRNWRTLWRWRLGADPERLAADYRK
jgi:hypothetical protein